jgi:hypothetical protein
MNTYFIIILLFFLFLFFQSHNEAFTKISNNFYDYKLNDITLETNNILLVGNISEEQLEYFYNTFKNTMIYIINEDKIIYKLEETTSIKRIKIVDEYPYDNNIINDLTRLNIMFDIILFSNIGTIENMIFSIKSYPILLQNNGKIVFENIQSYEEVDKIINNFPSYLKNQIVIYDNKKRTLKNDDIKIYYENL